MNVLTALPEATVDRDLSVAEPEAQLANQAQDWAQRLAQLLLDNGQIDRATLERALRAKGETGERLDRILVKLGLVEERPLAVALAQVLGLPFVERRHFPEHRLLADQLPERFLRHCHLMALQDNDSGLLIGMVDPLDDTRAKAIALRTGKPVSRAVVLRSELDNAFETLFEETASLSDIGDALADGSADEADVARLRDMANDAPIIRIVNLLIRKALEARASDIHIVPQAAAISVRFRVDGTLVDQDSPPKRMHAAILSRLKIMAGLNIAERRLPQDGRVKVVVSGREIDLRVATAPELHGESVVLRLLDKSSVTLDFASLGFDEGSIASIKSLLDQPNGIVLVTGPTGSGKTTTLYTALKYLSAKVPKIITVEDPIEYQIDGISQIQVKPDIDLTFAAALRSILRQDPDVIMIGEIRDVETAQIAVKAALTGHLVLATVHTNDAASTITRLIDMGVPAYLLASTLRGVIAQRLIRRLCQACKRPSQDWAKRTGSDGALAGPFFEAPGCDDCGGRGVKGRLVVNEVLTMSDDLHAAVTEGRDAKNLEQISIENGMRPLAQDAAAKAQKGLCSLADALSLSTQL